MAVAASLSVATNLRIIGKVLSLRPTAKIGRAFNEMKYPLIRILHIEITLLLDP
jgi:hypothetical protein